MRHLVWWIRSAFCNHEWEYDEQKKTLHDGTPEQNAIRVGVHVAMRCNKCGWHRSYWKH